MNSWYYSQADQAVGPFQMDVLGKLVQAGVIDDATPVRQADEMEWQPLSTVLTRKVPPPPAPVQNEARYYYLDAADQPIGPFDLATLQRLYTEEVFTADTLVSGVGEPEWIPAARLLKLPPAPPSTSLVGSTATTPGTVHPRRLSFEQYVLMMAATFSFYQFYLVPCQSWDLKAITGKERLAYKPLLILGIVTLSFALLVIEVVWAYDLERHGKEKNTAGRRESLGTTVLVLNALALILSYAIDGFVASFLVGALLNGAALWFLQKEINLYAATPVEVSPAF